MPLPDSTATFNALGIFGWLDETQEQYFQQVQDNYYKLSEDKEEFGIFPHLTLVAEYKVSRDDLPAFRQLIRELKSQLPLQIDVTGAKLVDSQNVALTFDIRQTAKIRDVANRYFPQGVVTTNYSTVMRCVPEKFHDELIGKLSSTKTLNFVDFKLCANRTDEAHILYSSTEL